MISQSPTICVVLLSLPQTQHLTVFLASCTASQAFVGRRHAKPMLLSASKLTAPKRRWLLELMPAVEKKRTVYAGRLGLGEGSGVPAVACTCLGTNQNSSMMYLLAGEDSCDLHYLCSIGVHWHEDALQAMYILDEFWFVPKQFLIDRRLLQSLALCVAWRLAKFSYQAMFTSAHQPGFQGVIQGRGQLVPPPSVMTAGQVPKKNMSRSTCALHVLMRPQLMYPPTIHATEQYLFAYCGGCCVVSVTQRASAS